MRFLLVIDVKVMKVWDSANGWGDCLSLSLRDLAACGVYIPYRSPRGPCKALSIRISFNQ